MTNPPAARATVTALLHAYYDAFGRKDGEGMIACLTDDVIHDVNQGERRVGVGAFRAFNASMDAHYSERLEELVVMVSEDGTRASAEFVVHGIYQKTADGLPEAKGQTYVLPAGTFFASRDGKIARVTTYYNLADWIAQVGG